MKSKQQTLAIFGGTPVSPNKLSKRSTIGKQEIIMADKVLKEGVISRAGRGKYVKLFEKEYASFHKVKYAISTTSGTTALHTALASLGINKGDEVLVPDLTFISTASIILQQFAKVVLVDINQYDFNIDIDDLQKKITTKTKAIIVVHMYGEPVNIEQIISIAKKNNLKVIEDCAQAHGAKYKNKYVGTWGDLGCFSFYQTKNITCGEGGMVITNNKKLYEACSCITDHGIINGRLEDYNYDRLGFNYHMTELQAAIGIAQLRRLNNFNKERRKNASIYKKYLKGTGIIFQNHHLESYNVYYVLTALLPEKLKKQRDFFLKAVRAENVEINCVYPRALHNTVLLNKKLKIKDFKHSTDVTERLINFYVNPGISKNYIACTCKAAIKVLNYLYEKYE
jgi:perosamine synthetase